MQEVPPGRPAAVAYLFHVQRTDSGGVTEARFTNHSLGELNLGRDVGHLH